MIRYHRHMQRRDICCITLDSLSKGLCLLSQEITVLDKVCHQVFKKAQ